MKMKSKKVLSILLALAVVFAMTTQAFAAWPSFQNDQTNNGVISAQPAVTTPSSVTGVTLPAVGAWTGVDAAPVIKDGRAYAVYNGGAYDAGTGLGGARLAITNLADGSVASALLDSKANNVSQLSTPYVTTINDEDVVFVGTSYETQVTNVTSFTGWTSLTPKAIIDESGTVTFSGKASIFGNVDVALTSSTLTVQTNLAPGTASSATYGIELSGTGGTFTLVPAGTGIYGTYGTYYTYNGATIPAGTYTATITVDPTSGTVVGSTFYLGGYGWQLNVVTDVATSSPTSSIAQYNQTNDIISAQPLNVAGEGQFNTPISYDSNGYIYFGIWGGTHTYYQYKYNAEIPSDGTLNTFKPTVTGSPSGFDDFYGTGAYSDGANVYFGSDNGLIYKRSVSAFWTTGTALNLAATQAAAGQVRSTVVFNGGSLYFTSKGTGSAGYLWKVAPSTLTPTTPIALAGNSTSTPVVSDNGYVYAGWYGYDPVTFASEGGLQAVLASSFSGTPINIYGGHLTPGDPVQSSPIVYSDGDEDYVYFTTNSDSGVGYCYYFDTSTPAIPASEEWSEGGTSGNPYAVQGFASDGGYLVYGDDGNYLYIMK